MEILNRLVDNLVTISVHDFDVLIAGQVLQSFDGVIGVGGNYGNSVNLRGGEVIDREDIRLAAQAFVIKAIRT